MYYPKSQIETGLYSNGELVIKSSQVTYRGKYWKTSDSKYWSGEGPKATNIKELELINDDITQDTPEGVGTRMNYRFYANNNVKYSNNKKIKKDDQLPLPPKYNQTIPNSEDYVNGIFFRYFCVKRNEEIYLEIDEKTYNKLVGEDPSVYYTLYKPFKISWKITGNKEEVTIINESMVNKVMFNLRLIYFDQYINKNYSKYLES